MNIQVVFAPLDLVLHKLANQLTLVTALPIMDGAYGRISNKIIIKNNVHFEKKNTLSSKFA